MFENLTLKSINHYKIYEKTLNWNYLYLCQYYNLKKKCLCYSKFVIIIFEKFICK